MREQRKQLVGVVTSDKMDKTIVVSVATTQRHPIYGKVVNRPEPRMPTGNATGVR